jgi:CubicO group peptidase (beta-lactamase class C family)
MKLTPVATEQNFRLATLIIMIALAFSPAQLPAGAQVKKDPLGSIFTRWNDSIPKLIQQRKIFGMTLAVVDRSGILWTGCFGYTDSTCQQPVNNATLFSVQSMSKNLTALAILKAVNDGLLDLDEPITAYLHGFTVNSRYESYPEDKITLRLLLSHRAGFTHEAPVGNNYYNEGSFDDHIRSIPATWLRYPVGQRYSYSNLGVDLAGYILALKTEMSFDEYLEKNILLPCNMKRSSFDMDRIRMDGNRATGYSSPAIEAPFYFAMKPSGGLYADIIDMANYVMVHLNSGRQGNETVVPEGILTEMYRIPDPLPRQISGYGLGLSIRNDYGLTLMNHGGSGFGFCSNMIWTPEYGIGIVMLSNASYLNFQNSLPMAILFDVIESRTGKRLTEEFPPTVYEGEEIVVDSLYQKRLAGNYLNNRSGSMTLEYCDNRLGIKPEGPQFYPAIFTSRNEFNFGAGPYPTYFSIYPESESTPGYLIRNFDAEYLDRNDGPFDQPGPAKEEWSAFTGKYSYHSQGRKSPNTIPVTVNNGYLYVYNYRLTEYIPGLFFTAHGEALDFRGDQPTWRNIMIMKED